MLLIFKVWITSFRQRTKGSTCLKRYWKLWKSTNMFSRAKFLMHASCQDSCQYSRSSDCSIRFVVSCCCLFEQVADMENTGTAFPSFMATWAHVSFDHIFKFPLPENSNDWSNVICLFACLFTFLQHNHLAHLSYCYCWQCWLSLHPLNPRPPHCFPHACVLPKENKHIKCTSFIKQLETLLLTQKSTGKLMLTRLRPKVSSHNIL